MRKSGTWVSGCLEVEFGVASMNTQSDRTRWPCRSWPAPMNGLVASEVVRQPDPSDTDIIARLADLQWGA
jgi:hypothetical protein